MHSVLALALVYSPEGHAAHPLVVSAAVYVPISHARQALAPGLLL